MANPPIRKAGPVHTTRQAFQVSSCGDADGAHVIFVTLQRFDESYFPVPGPPFDVIRVGLFPFKVYVYPGNE